jgi:hypothetical protein
MKRASMGVLALCLGIAGCGGGDRNEEGRDSAGSGGTDVSPVPVTETGCLTARGGQFVLTDLDRGASDPTTETYQLIGNEEELRQHVGKQVRVNGEAEPPKVATVQESTPTPPDSAARGTTGMGETGPKVSTQAETRLEVRKLTVSSVQPTGESCAAEATGDGAAPTKPRQ